MQLGAEGRGRALRTAWSTSSAPVVAYMDVDLVHRRSTPCCRWWRRCCRATATWPSAPGWPAAPAWSAAPSASSSPRAYNLLLRAALRSRFSDAQCGFKAMRRDAALSCSRWSRTTSGSSTPSSWSPRERLGLRIREVPVDWVDDPDSRVEIVAHRPERPRAGCWRARGGPARPARAPATAEPQRAGRPGRRRAAPALRRRGGDLARVGLPLPLRRLRAPQSGSVVANALGPRPSAALANTAVHRRAGARQSTGRAAQWAPRSAWPPCLFGVEPRPHHPGASSPPDAVARPHSLPGAVRRHRWPTWPRPVFRFAILRAWVVPTPQR